MKFGNALFASLALCASFGAQAVTGSTGGGVGTFLTLSAPAPCTLLVPCTLTGSVNATIRGGTVYNMDQPFADIPKGAIANGRFLSAGPTSTEPSTVTFDSPLDYVSFLWGSPDTYNSLTVITTLGEFAFTAAGITGFTSTNGDQNYSQYVEFNAGLGEDILGLRFENFPAINAFEVANFTVTAAVPEPETYALMLAGLGMVGFIRRRRRQA